MKLSETILDKNLNPFALKEVDYYTLKLIYMKLKLLWINKFDNEKIIMDINEESLKKTKIFTDIRILEILFLDIIENISKNKCNENYSIKIEMHDEKVLIVFSNEVEMSPKDRKNLIKNIRLFNNDDRMQLLLKKGHGFANIKEMVTNLEIKCNMTLVNNDFTIELTLYINEGKANESISNRRSV